MTRRLEAPRRLSASSLRRYLTCPKQFYFADVERQRRGEARGPQLAMGNAVHHTLERFHGLAVGDRSEEVLHRALRTVWPRHRGDAFRDTEEEAEWGRKALAMLSRYAAGPDLLIQPLARERWASAGFGGGRQVFGKIDRVDPTPSGLIEVVDYKTGSFVPADPLSDDPAAQVYLVAAEETFKMNVERVRFLYLPTGTERLWAPSRGDVAELRSELDQITREVASAQEFPARPGEDACRLCPFQLACPDAHRVELSDLQPAESLPF